MRPMYDSPDPGRKREVREALERDRQRLLLKQPFIGAVLLRLDLVPVVDGRLRSASTDGAAVYVDCAFYASLSAGERLFVLAHEAWHVVLLHALRLQARERRAFETACDLEVHFLLQSEKMDEPFVLPHDPAWKGLSAEQIYEKLAEGPSPCGGFGAGGNSASPCAPRPSRRVNLGGGQASRHIRPLDDGEGFDRHDFLPDSGEEDDSRAAPFDPDYAPLVPADLAERTRRAIVAAAQQAERIQGVLPAHVQRIVNAVREPELDWRELLQQFLTKAYGGRREWLPPARRYAGMGLYLQSRRDVRLEAVLAIDTSGSVSDDLPAFFGELSGLLNAFGNYGLTVLQCDSAIQRVDRFSSESPLPGHYRWEARGLGGTDFRPPFDYVREHRLAPKLFLYLTDGLGPAPEKAPPYPVLWVLARDGRESPAPWGAKLRLPMIRLTNRRPPC